MKYFIIPIFLFLSLSCNAQNLITNNDVINFWVAYDQIQKTKDSLKQIEIINNEYLQKASQALKAMIKMDKMDASDYLKSIHKNTQRWNEVRLLTLEIAQEKYDTEKMYTSFKKVYPKFHSPQISFVIGTFDRGGTTTKDFILIGTEVAALTSLSGQKLKESTEYNIAHELVHVQQDYVNEVDNEEEYKNLDLLGWALMEGSCDFVAEKLLGKLPSVAYLEYGRKHEKELWEEFKQDMFLYDIEKWMYNGSSSKNRPADLAYFIGYTICKSYYDQAQDKNRALNEIVSINYSKNEHHAFFDRAGYQK